VLAFAVLAIVFLHVTGSRAASSAGDVYAVLAATALAAVLVVILRLQVVLDTAAVGETLRQWAVTAVYVIAARVAASWYTSPSRANARDDGADFFLLAARELARARRHGLPLTAVVLDPRPHSPLDLRQRECDLHELCAVLEREVRLIDAFGIVDGRIVALLPDTRCDALAPLLDRVRSGLSPELVERLCVGHASFPDEETTFVGLHERAAARTARVQSAEPLPQEAVA
jgi:hypothetical protein